MKANTMNKLILLLLLCNACGANITMISSGGGGNHNTTESDPGTAKIDPPTDVVVKDDDTTIANVEPCSQMDNSGTCVSSKTAFEIISTMSSVTGISSGSTVVATTFKEVKQSLPMERKISSLSSSGGNAIFKLAESYCSEMMKNATLRSKLIPTGATIADTSTAASIFGAAADPQGARRMEVIKKMLDEFWGSGIQSTDMKEGQSMNRESAEKELDSLFVKLMANPVAATGEIQATLNTNHRAFNVMAGVCIPALAAAPVILK